MSTAVMSSPMFECGDLLFDKNPATTKLKDTTSNANAGTANTNGRAPLRHSYTSLVKLIQEQHHKLYRSVSEPTSRYKTELCRPFEESGACKYGDKCQFAHGYSELRNLARHPKYKTELCRTFHTIGFCPYGPRCHFIHNFEEARIHNQKVSAQLGSTQPNIMNLNPPLQSGTTTSIGTTTAAATSNGNVNVNVNVSLLEQIASSPQIAAAAAAAAAVSSSTAGTNTPLMRTNSLSLGTQISNVYNPPPLLRTNSLSLTTTSHHHHHHPLHHQQQQHHHQQQQQQQQQQIPHHHHQHHHHQSSAISVIGSTRPKPLNLSPTFSLGSTADSVSPSSSLSQSPTNSMASFFSDDQQQQLQSSNNSLSTNAFCFGQDFGLLTSVTRQSPSPSSHTNGICSPIHSDDISPRTPSPLSPNSESRLPVFNRISSTLSDFENLKI